MTKYNENHSLCGLKQIIIKYLLLTGAIYIYLVMTMFFSVKLEQLN